MFNTHTYSYDEVEQSLTEALKWAESLQVTTTNCRFQQYLRTIQLIRRRWKEGATSASEVPIDALKMETAFSEAMLFGQVYKALRYCESQFLPGRLKKLMKGPAWEGDEKAENAGNVARDTGFELEVASRFAPIGELELPNDRDVDAIVRADGISFFFECKRLSSDSNVKRRLGEARSQLLPRLQTKTECYGIVALSAAKMEWPHGAILRTESLDEMEGVAAKWVAEFHKRHIEPWISKEPNPRLAAVLVHIPFVAYIGGSQPTPTASYWMLTKPGADPRIEDDVKRFVDKSRLVDQ